VTARHASAFAWIALAAIVVALLAWALWPSGSTSDAARARHLAAELRCPDCESLSTADSQTESARAIRRDIRLRIAEGESDAVIRQAYVDRYGDSILLKPAGDGLGMIVWGLPVALVVVGAAGLVVVFRRWQRTEPLQATAADEALVRRARGGNERDDSAS
jgi:cytochrome c-type biogenesis protein CcmH